MNIVFGDLWTAPEHYLRAVTTNSTIDRNGSLVMGRGAAGQLAERSPSVPALAGAFVRHSCKPYGRYGWKVLRDGRGVQYGLFQTKTDYKHASSLDLVHFSAEMLYAWLIAQTEHRYVALNFPGIGLGRLEPQEVYDTLASIFGHDDRLAVYIWPQTAQPSARRRPGGLPDGVLRPGQRRL